MTATVLTVLVTVGFLGGILLLLPRLARPTIPFGVRVPESQVGASVIRRATRQYYRGVVLAMFATTAFLVALAPVVRPEIILTVAPFIALAAWLVPHLNARRMVQAAKRSEGWYEGVRQVAATDTSLRTSPPRYPWLWAAPSIAIVLTTLAVGLAVYPSLPDQIATHFGADGPDRFAPTTVWSAFGLVGLQALVTVMILGPVAIVLRSKADIAATTPQTSADQYRRYAVAISRAVLALAAGVNLTMLGVALLVWEVLPATTGWLVAVMIPSAAGTVALLVVAIRAGQSGHRLRSTTPPGPPQAGTADRDDDAHWIGGLIYVNRDDPAVFVPKRFGGVGWTVNLARPAAWITLVVVLGGSLGLTIWALAQASGPDEAATGMAAEHVHTADLEPVAGPRPLIGSSVTSPR